MRSITVILLFAFSAQFLAASHHGHNSEKLVDTLVDKQFDNMIVALSAMPSLPSRNTSQENMTVPNKSSETPLWVSQKLASYASKTQEVSPPRSMPKLPPRKKDHQNLTERRSEVPSASQSEELKTQAIALYSAGYAKRAFEKLSSAIELDPQNPSLYSIRCATNIKLKQNKDALADAEKCTQLNQSWPEGWVRLGQALTAGGQQTAAIEAYRTGLTFAPSDRALRTLLQMTQSQHEEEKKNSRKELISSVAKIGGMFLVFILIPGIHRKSQSA